MQFSMNATCGCRQPLRSQTKTHYHKKLTLISEVSLLCFDAAAAAAAATESSLFCNALQQTAANQAVDFIFEA